MATKWILKVQMSCRSHLRTHSLCGTVARGQKVVNFLGVSGWRDSRGSGPPGHIGTSRSLGVSRSTVTRTVRWTAYITHRLVFVITMNSQNPLFPVLLSHRQSSQSNYDIEERRRLLNEDCIEKSEPETQPRAWPTQKIAITTLILTGLLITGTVAWMDLIWPYSRHKFPFHEDALRSNGTHDFRRTVLMVSIDGLRCLWSFLL